MTEETRSSPALPKHNRVVYRGETCILDELEMIGWSNFTSAVPGGLASHIHNHAYEICFICQGDVQWWVKETLYSIQRGDLFVTRPGEPHGGMASVMHRCELFWLQLRRPQHDYPLPGLTIAETRSLISDLENLEHRSFLGIPHIRTCFSRILAEQERPLDYSVLVARAALHDILVSVIRSYRAHLERTPPQKRHLSSEIETAMRWMEDRITEQFSTEDVARAMNISAGHFQKRFLEEAGVTPAEYHTRQRMKRAKRLLENETISVSDIAWQLGFSTSQYFATVFKKFTGMTPTQYRKNRNP